MTQFKQGDKVKFKAGEFPDWGAFGLADPEGIYELADDPDDSFPSAALVHIVGHDSDGGVFVSRLELAATVAPAATSIAPETPKRDYVADHARRTLRKAGLTAVQAAAYVKAVQLHGKDWPVGPGLDAICTNCRIDLSKLSRSTHGLTLRSIVGDSFAWAVASNSTGVDFGALHSELSAKDL